mmetsp:Transcript_34618/g.108716  ORF Transcript_34618/g.108716 Transcript_34618/m.108716 type:complete len:259 (+) Transcript_34618:81-857(+)
MELLDLSPDLLALLLAHCTHTDWAHCACTCAALRSAVGDQRECCLSATELSLGKLPLLLCPSLRQLSSLRELRLRWVPIGDAHLSAVAGLPQLSLLDLTGAARVTNNGVRLVLAGCPAIEELHLTFCECVGYVVVLEAMRRCPRLRLLRRQPEWMDGTFLTPWGEEHTYYADGSFQFSRASESRGWVCQCRPLPSAASSDVVEDRLLYTDIDGTWSHNGRVGVLMRPHSKGRREIATAEMQRADVPVATRAVFANASV